MSGLGFDRAFWEGKYARGEDGWDRGEVSPALLDWLALDQGQHQRVLVPGCGRGYEVVALAEAGYSVTAIDLATPALEALGERLEVLGLSQRVRLVQEDVLSWQPDSPLDAVYEQTCLCALSPPQWPAYAAQLRQWLRPGGVLVALFMQTGRDGGPPFHCELSAMEDLFDAQDWAWEAMARERVPHRNGLFERAFLLRRIGR